MCDDHLPLPRVSDCICTDLKMGCIIFGWISLICSIIGVGTLNLYHHDEHYDGVIYPTLGTGIVLSIILLIGLHADIPILVQIYYFIILISIILMIISFIVYLIRGRIWGAVSFIIACIFYFVVVIYTRSCFYSMM
ncbi:hypothetical protein JYU34_013880 [Plutella xylostella]|uniref:Uncharacterized protein n=2 Tax=Plutella xylostella TaxID=51655 RepID=A0ABQ7QBU8_PLUXY|nr:hypothetical protein JYU34_013880 [Plutella xylostella]CAG9138259.1 unnamed protein product [Plutella xylostella]